MSVRPIDTFITNSVKLFEANPSQATISITYAHNPELERTRVTFRSSNPHLNSTYKFATNKSKDVSRLLNALGPRGVTVVPGKIERQVLRKQGKSKSKSKSKKRFRSVNVIGIGNLIANTRVKRVKPATERKAVKAAATTTTTTSSTSNNNNNNSNSNTSGGGNNNASGNTNTNEPTSSVSSKKNKGKGKSKGKGRGKGKR